MTRTTSAPAGSAPYLVNGCLVAYDTYDCGDTSLVRGVIAVIIALFFTGSAMAKDWKDYENPEYAFAIHFPLHPTLEATTYRTADGRSFDAHTFSVEQQTGLFKVTVVEMPGEQTGEDASVVGDAAKTVAEGGVIKFDIPHRVSKGLRLPTRHRRGERWLYLCGACFSQVATVPGRGESARCRWAGGG
jgi:hypothetical protein